MKKFILVLIVILAGAVTSAEGEGDNLRRMASRIYDLVNRYADQLSLSDSRAVEYHLREVRALLTRGDDGIPPGDRPLPPGNPGRPTPTTGYFCSAACTFSNGKVDGRHSAGAWANFEIEARQRAIEAVRARSNCSYSIANIECSPGYPRRKFSSIAGCTFSNGTVDLRHSSGASGTAAAEARQKARQAVSATKNCSYGVDIYITSDDSEGAQYCIASCSTSSGGFDGRTSQGASGENKAEAIANAIKAVNAVNNCTYGIAIDKCGR